MSASVRVRLTLWYSAALAAVLVAYAAGVGLFLRQRLTAELDRALREDIARAEERLEATDDGRLVWRSRHASGTDDTADDETPGPWLEIWTPDRGLLLRGTTAPPLGLPAPDPPPTGPAPSRSLELPEGGTVRVLDARSAIGGVSVLVRAGRSEERYRHDVRELAMAHALAVPLAVALAALGGYLLARRALLPVARMTAQARRVSAERLGERLPVENPSDELGQLAAAFNETFARLERSFDQLRRFTADASHELRTPLTAIRSVGEVGLAERPGEQGYREVIGSILEETDRLTQLVDTLLTLSRADAGEPRLGRETVDLAALAREVAADLSVLAEEKDQPLAVEAPGMVEILGDRLVLQQALVNLVGNAVKYSPRGCPIRVVVAGDRDTARVEVVDRGPGIAPEHRERVFERFYRIDASRSRDAGGAGLGLPLAQWAVATHGGRLELESTPGAGSTFRITLPRGPNAGRRTT